VTSRCIWRIGCDAANGAEHRGPAQRAGVGFVTVDELLGLPAR
jgi:hypothetical protein